ncbi:flavodoxin family protein [Caloranaerobacter ferrireducens]|uniref:flavodoxin family protein n=1 Tax=Caloranaerobacter ferrireducens TaxID=1323370 RepID=UPI00084DA063|nr:flavodoxin [Caloranaerobacter ferrireducens]
MDDRQLKKLVIYYSLEGNTEFIAENIADVINADILKLKTEKEISTHGLMRYFLGGKQVVLKEKPKLFPLDKNPDNYDVIFIGTPVWAGTYAPAFNTFFDTIKLKDKYIALFCCYSGKSSSTFKNMRKELKDNQILGEIGFRDPLKYDKEQNANKVRQWAEDIISKINK